MTSISPARIVAARVLQEVETNPHSQAAEALNAAVRADALRADDARLARKIVFGVLRHAPTLDYYYAPYLKQSSAKLLPQLRLCLRMAALQHYMLSKIPAYAIVNETVAIARSIYRLKPPQVGFLNAVLRKLVATAEPRLLPSGNRITDLAIRFGLPDAYVRLLVEKYGTHKAVVIMDHVKSEPELTVRVNTLQTSTEALSQALLNRGFGVTPAVFCPDSLVVSGNESEISLFETPEFFAGHFYVQDEASQLVALLAAPKPGETILDLCAAPGGKTTHMAELANGKAAITATDASPDRLQLVEENVHRLHTPGISVEALAEVLESPREYDVVLVDAPCSGAGTVRRNPEIAHRITEAALEHHASRQLDVLLSAASHVRPGGRLIYSTCSISSRENETVIGKFLQQHPEFIIADTPHTFIQSGSNLGSLRAADGFYRTWPDHPAIDGFEAVILHRKTQA